MISISIHRDSEGRAIGVCASGHAGFRRAGKDIVCAAISVLVINTINSIEALTEDAFRCDQDEKSATIDFVMTQEPSEQSLLLIQSLLIGIEWTQQNYGSKYITYTEEV